MADSGRSAGPVRDPRPLSCRGMQVRQRSCPVPVNHKCGGAAVDGNRSVAEVLSCFPYRFQGVVTEKQCSGRAGTLEMELIAVDRVAQWRVETFSVFRLR